MPEKEDRTHQKDGKAAREAEPHLAPCLDSEERQGGQHGDPAGKHSKTPAPHCGSESDSRGPLGEKDALFLQGVFSGLSAGERTERLYGTLHRPPCPSSPTLLQESQFTR